MLMGNALIVTTVSEESLDERFLFESDGQGGEVRLYEKYGRDGWYAITPERRRELHPKAYYRLPIRAVDVWHPPCEPRLGCAEGDGGKVAEHDIPIAERNVGRGDFTRNHFLRVIEEILVVWGVASIADDKADPRPASRTSAALGVVVGTRWDVA
jgi:hypothetical protein